MKLNIEIEKHLNNTVIVRVFGEVDLYTSPDLRKQILSAVHGRPAMIIVDLQHVNYMDSSGVATLVEGLQQVSKYKGKFGITHLRSGVREVFELSRLDRVFDIYDSVELAMEANH